MRKLALLGVAVAFLLPIAVSAESAQWSQTIPGTFFACGDPGSQASWYGYDCFSVLENLQASITYDVTATNDTTGADACNTSVPAGTRIDFTFTPRESQDISWFGTGFDMDSPYGGWSIDANSPTLPSGGKAEEATPADPTQWCNMDYYLNTWGYGSNNSYVLFEVNPPLQQLQNTSGLTCDKAGADGSVSCTAMQPGTINPTFDFGTTYGKFYYAILYGPIWPYGCVAFNLPLASLTAQSGVFGTELANNPGNAYLTQQVPEQQISCPITVTSASGTQPTIPNVTTPGGGGAGGGGGGGGSGGGSGPGSACTIGVPYVISFVSTDPDGNQIKYGIDWDDNGTIDEMVPSAGYVPSGTTETASRTFATGGNKTIRVIAINSNGLTSGWATLTTTCTDQSGQAEIIEAGGTEVGSGATGGADSSPDLQISAEPSIVKPGETTHVFWSASDVLSSSCIVTGSNGDGGQGVTGWIGAVSDPAGILSSAIDQQTTYTLACEGLDGTPLTQSTTVNIIPVFNEQ